MIELRLRGQAGCRPRRGNRRGGNRDCASRLASVAPRMAISAIKIFDKECLIWIRLTDSFSPVIRDFNPSSGQGFSGFFCAVIDGNQDSFFVAFNKFIF
jgi:hypothetical protein